MRISRLLLAGSFALSLPACAPGRPAATSPAADPSGAFKRFVSFYYEQDDVGVSRDPLDRLSDEAPYRQARRAARMLELLRTIDTMRLQLDERVDWLLMESQLKRIVFDTVLHAPERMPSRYVLLGDLHWRVAGDRPPTAQQWQEIRQLLDRAPAALRLGRKQVLAPPPLWNRLAIATARSYSGFLRGEFVTRAAAAPDTLRDSVLAAGHRAAGALDAFAAYLQDTIVTGADDSWSAGRAYYDFVLREVNFLPLDAAGMIAAGRQIHEATKLALDSLAQRLRPGTPWRVLVAEMQGRHPEPGRITDAYRRHSDRVLALLRRDSLVTIPPRESLTFVPTPPQLRETYAWGGYGGITLRDSVMVGRFFVTDVVPSMTAEQVAEKLRTQNDGWIPVIALHEGYPGHHLQQVYARRNPSRVRRSGGNTYYGEGWALYAEHWMARAGLFDTPDARLGQLQMRLWRTARVVIDPSLHTGAMTYEQAVRFFMDEVGLERSAAEAEVNRFTTWPTQAPSYIIGWLEIERLEREVRAALGDRFDHRQFVERVLQAGPLPPLLLRRVVLEAYGVAPGAGD